MRQQRRMFYVVALLGAALALVLGAASLTQAGQDRPSAQLASAPYAGVYVGRDYRNIDPTIYPAVGGQYMFSWRELEPQEGNYQWQLIEHWVQAEALQSGKRAAFALTTYNGRIEGGIQVPAWVYDPGQGGNSQAVISCSGILIPRYWNQYYLTKYQNFVRALGARFNADPRVTWVQIGSGLYGETQPADDQDDQCVKNALAADIGSSEPAIQSSQWVTTVNTITDFYVSAFPSTTLFLQFAPSFIDPCERKRVTDYAGARAVGLFNAGLLADFNNAVFPPMSRTAGCGAYEPYLTWMGRVPFGWESYRYLLPTATHVYWAVFNALDKHADYINFEHDLFHDSSGNPIPDNFPYFEFANRYLGRTITDTPSVWVALRDHRQEAPGNPYWPQWGNYSYWLYQDDNVAGGRTVTETNDSAVYLPTYNPTLPPGKEGWVTRRTDQASGNPSMWFKIDDGYINGNSPSAGVQVTYWDHGTDTWALLYDSTRGEQAAVPQGSSQPWVQKQNSNTWKVASFVLSDGRLANGLAGGSDFRIDSRNDGDEWVHFVKVIKGGFPTPTPTPVSYDQAVNAGASLPYTDSLGIVWERDRTYLAGSWGNTGGRVYVTAAPITGTDDDVLYQSQRFQMPSYQFDVPPGVYRVDLRFAETFYGVPNDRVFNVYLEGQPVLMNFDILVAAGGWYTALDRSFDVTVTDGRLDVTFVDKRQTATIAGLRVRGLSSTVTATPTSSATMLSTATPSQTATATPSVTATASGTPTQTATVTPTASPSPAATATATPTATTSPTMTEIPSESATPTSTATTTGVSTTTATASPEGTNTSTATASTPAKTATPTPTPTATWITMWLPIIVWGHQ